MGTISSRYYSNLVETSGFLRSQLGNPPSVAVVLGSGLKSATRAWPSVARIPYKDIPHFPVPTVPGHGSVLGMCENRGRRFVVLTGRCHRYEGLPFADVVFGVRALAVWGVPVFLLTNAAGGINPAFRPGDLMLIADHVNLMGANPLLGAHIPELGERFVDLTEAYDGTLRVLAHQCAQQDGLKLQEGVYLAVTGPNYETPAEIRMFSRWGVDAVGMSTVPESIALAQLGRRVLGISCISNMAAGMADQPLSHVEVLAAAEGAGASLGRLILRLVASI